MNLGASLPAKSPPPESAAGEGDGDWRGRCRSCGYRRGKQPGAIVRAFDTRPEVKEQVQSMGLSSSNWILKRKPVAAMVTPK